MYSLIIPTYKRVHLLKETIQYNIHNMGIPREEVEIIWVDDGSNDLEVFNIMNSINPEISLISKENLGTIKSKNRGLALSSGEFIIVMDSDFKMSSNWLLQVDKYLKRIPSLHLIALSNFFRNHWEGKSVEIDGLKLSIMNINLATGVFLVSRRAFQQVGYLDEEFGFYGLNDAEWTMRMKRNGFKPYYIPGVGGKHLGVINESGDNRKKKNASLERNKSILNKKEKEDTLYYNPTITSIENEVLNEFRKNNSRSMGW